MTWQEVFEANKHKVGRAVHEAWMAEKQRQGFADHPLLTCPDAFHTPGPHCGLPYSKHHTDMLDYDDLPENVREYDIQTGIIGFRMGFEAARELDR